MNANLRSINLILFFCMLLVSHSIFADVKSELGSMTSIEKPFELRDPFQTPLVKKERDDNKVQSKVATGVYSNLPTLGDIKLSELRVVGVLIGKERRAVVTLDGKPETYLLQEGQVLGENEAELKAIVPGGVILVEKIINVYGEEEYLETVIPISK